MNDLTKTDITELLDKYGLSPLKKLGQNFLTDSNIVGKIAEAAGITSSSNVIEIGPGLGSLTGRISDTAKRVVCIELDSGLMRVLEDRFKDTGNVTLIHGDILKTDLNETAEKYFGGEDFIVVGNLPYYITAKTIIRICESGAKSMTVMIQKEVADRLASPPGSRDYGSITASVAYYGAPELMFTVPGSCFYPVPDVESAVVTTDLKKDVLKTDRKNYVKVVRASFAQRRKTIFNNLCSAFGKECGKERIAALLGECGIKKEARAESLSREDFASIAEKLFK